jgi:hypothetical protein
MDISRFRPSLTSRLLYVLLVIVAMVLGVELLQAALPKYIPWDWARAHDLDALIDWKAARLAFQGKSPYTPEGLRYIGATIMGHPPTTSFWFLPLAEMEKATAAELVSLAVWFGLVIHVFLCARELKYPAPVPLTVLVCGAVLSTTWMVHHFHVIQLSEHIAFAYVVSWYYLRRGREIPAGIALGAAASLKLFPGLLFVMLLMGRRWKAFIAATATFLAILGVMLKFFGVQGWILFFEQSKPTADDWIGYVRNGSIHGIISRIGMPICTGDSIPSRTTTLVALAVSVVILAAAIWLCWKPLKKSTTDWKSIDLPFALFTLLSVFLNAWAWEHYYVLIIHPMFVMGAEFWRYFLVGFRRWSEQRASHWALVRTTLIAGTSAGSLVLLVKLLSYNMWTKERLVSMYTRTKGDWYHSKLHLLEVINWLPWVIALVVCMIWMQLTRYRWSGTAPPPESSNDVKPKPAAEPA